MTKAEALEAIKAGNKVTHRHFSRGEWMKKGTTLALEFEDGCQCSNSQFWAVRTEESWLTGWSVFDK